MTCSCGWTMLLSKMKQLGESNSVTLLLWCLPFCQRTSSAVKPQGEIILLLWLLFFFVTVFTYPVVKNILSNEAR